MLMKQGMVTFSGDKPLELTDDAAQDFPGDNDEQKRTISQMGATVKAYLKAAEELLNGKYAHIKDLAPIHLADPGNVLVVCCSDGVVIRYERKADQEAELRVFGAWMAESMPEAASMLSQNIINCYPDRNYTSSIPTTGSELKLFTVNASTKEQTNIASARIGFDTVIEQPEHLPKPPQKPFCLLSVRNTFEVQLLGDLLPVDDSRGRGNAFLPEVHCASRWDGNVLKYFRFST